VQPPVDAFDKNREAKLLFDKAHDALEDGDPEQALELLEQSLKLRRTARTYLERARALQRLQRIDEAVAAVDEAIGINPKYAPAYEQKGMILWSAQRYAEARPPLEKYLELDPEGRRAAIVRGMLDEPR
jgi:tetratricopeptide (TPR) repeat protein